MSFTLTCKRYPIRNVLSEVSLKTFRFHIQRAASDIRMWRKEWMCARIQRNERDSLHYKFLWAHARLALATMLKVYQEIYAAKKAETAEQAIQEGFQ